MGAWVENDIIAKGPVPHWLDRCSIDANAFALLQALREAINGIGPTYHGLERVFDEHLGIYFCHDAELRRRIADHLKRHWFSDAPEAWFPGQNVTQKYATAVIKTIELSLSGRHHPVPINAWWIMQRNDPIVSMLNLAEVNRQGIATSSSVTLLIQTPKPPTKGGPSKTSLWGEAEAWVTQDQNGSVLMRQIEKEAK